MAVKGRRKEEKKGEEYREDREKGEWEREKRLGYKWISLGQGRGVIKAGWEMQGPWRVE